MVKDLILSLVASTDILATVLEEMLPFPECELSILDKLKFRKEPEAGSTLDHVLRDLNSNDISGSVYPTPCTM